MLNSVLILKSYHLPSTPWHITIGNPLRPIFCAGDMYMADDMILKLGPNLAFNDLPSNIIAEFTLTNARAWGLQEILAKFNAGSLRVSNGLRDANSLKIGEILENGRTEDGEVLNDSGTGTASISSVNNIPGNSAQSPTSLVTNNATQTTSLTNVNVPSTGPLTDEDLRNATLKQDPPNSTNFINSPPFNSTPTLVNVNKPDIINSDNISGISTTKEGNSGEQIVKDANSPIPVSLQDLEFTNFRI